MMQSVHPTMLSIQARFRLARMGEAVALNDLANRSKAYWPYDEGYLELCRGMTHIDERYLNEWPVMIAELDGLPAGFAAIARVRDLNMLDHLWVDPRWIGQGVGKTLLTASVELARRMGWTGFHIASDPFAEKFYLKQGAVRVGEWPSKVKSGFFLPLLRLDFTPLPPSPSTC